jgi:hypothetical protein
MKKFLSVVSTLMFAVIMTCNAMEPSQGTKKDSKPFFGLFNKSNIAQNVVNSAFASAKDIPGDATGVLAEVAKIAKANNATVKIATDESKLGNEEPAFAANGGILINQTVLSKLSAVDGVNIVNAITELVVHEKTHNQIMNKKIQGNLSAQENDSLSKGTDEAKNLAEEAISASLATNAVVAKDAQQVATKVIVQVKDSSDIDKFNSLAVYSNVEFVTSANLKNMDLSQSLVITADKEVKGKITVNVPTALSAGAGSIAYIDSIVQTIKLAQDKSNDQALGQLVALLKIGSVEDLRKALEKGVVNVLLEPAAAFNPEFVSNWRKALEKVKGL